MSGYINRLLEIYKYEKKSKLQYVPCPAQQRKFGKAAQDPMPEDILEKFDNKQRKRVQQVVGSM